MSDMTRRAFVTLLGSAAIWPFAALAEKSDGVRRVGVIMGFAESDGEWQTYLSTFRRTLQDLGWTDGRNIRFDYRFTGDSEERMRSTAEEIVGLAPDVILTATNSAVSATLNATRSIPIVFTWVSDPVGSGFVTNLPHQEGKITGFHNFEPAIGGKWTSVSEPDRTRAAPGRCRACSGSHSECSLFARNRSRCPSNGIGSDPGRNPATPPTSSEWFPLWSDSKAAASS